MIFSHGAYPFTQHLQSTDSKKRENHCQIFWQVKMKCLLWYYYGWSYNNATYRSPIFRSYFIVKTSVWLVQESLRGSRMPQKSAIWQKSNVKICQTMSSSVYGGIQRVKNNCNLSTFPGGLVDRAPAAVEHFAQSTGSIPTSGNIFLRTFYT